MRRNARSVSLPIWLLFGAALAAAATLAGAHAAADDADTCEEASADLAVAACTRAIASGRYEGRGLARLHYNRAIEHAEKGDNDRAIADYSEAIRLDPNDADFYNNRGSAWRAKGDNDRAIADHNEAIRLDPKVADFYYRNRSTVYKAKGELRRALADYIKAIALELKAVIE